MAILNHKISSKANLCIRLFLLALVLLSQSNATAQPNVKPDIYVAYSQYFNFQLDSCARTIDQLPPDPLTFYLDVLLTSTTVIIEDHDALDKSTKNKENEFLTKLDKTDFNEPNTNFLKSEIKLQWAILKLKNGDDFSSFWNLKQAYTLAQDNVKKYPEFLPSYKTLGLLHILFGVFPEKYHWILSILGIEGNVALGLTELEKTYHSTNFFSLESGLIQALAYTYLLNSPGKAVEMLSEIHGRNEHLLIEYAFALVLMKDAQSERALHVIENAERKYPQPFAIPQLFYLKGEILMQKGQLDEAIKNYRFFLTNFSGQNLVKDTYYKIGICYLLKDKPERANMNFVKSKESGRAKNETDKNAQIAIKQEGVSSKELYKMRYATDGGYYEKALKIQESIDSNTLSDHDRCEFYYRSARLFQKSGNISKAIAAYEKTIDTQQTPSWYFAPNSALHLGLLYLDKKENEKALKYLKLVNNYDRYPYQTSIEQKAAFAIKSIK
jgi:tetratricopeptide (TPR) repeat protein